MWWRSYPGLLADRPNDARVELDHEIPTNFSCSGTLPIPLACRLRIPEPYTDCYNYLLIAVYKARGLCIGEERGEKSLTNHKLRGSARDHQLRCCGRSFLTLRPIDACKPYHDRYAAGSMYLLPLRCHCRTPCTQQATKVLSIIMRRLSHGPCIVLPIETLS